MVERGSFYSDRAYEFHEYANIFPYMNSEELKELGRSIKVHGQEQDIILYEGKILDGRNTYYACRCEGITPRYNNYKSKLDPFDYVRIKNFYRRHLSTAQKAAIALKFLEIERTKAKERIARTQFKTKSLEENLVGDPGSLAVKGRAIDIVAKEHKIAPKTLIKAEKIEKASRLDPEINEKWEKAKKNEMSLEEVYRAVKKKDEIKIKKGIVNKFVETGRSVSKKETACTVQEEKSSNVEGSEKEQEDKCQNCEKATVFAITCEMCGHPTPRVLCDNDFINNNKRLVNPNQKKCVLTSNINV